MASKGTITKWAVVIIGAVGLLTLIAYRLYIWIGPEPSLPTYITVRNETGWSLPAVMLRFPPNATCYELRDLNLGETRTFALPPLEYCGEAFIEVAYQKYGGWVEVPAPGHISQYDLYVTMVLKPNECEIIYEDWAKHPARRAADGR